MEIIEADEDLFGDPDDQDEEPFEDSPAGGEDDDPEEDEESYARGGRTGHDEGLRAASKGGGDQCDCQKRFDSGRCSARKR